VDVLQRPPKPRLLIASIVELPIVSRDFISVELSSEPIRSRYLSSLFLFFDFA
jgi:hypothetical protein